MRSDLQGKVSLVTGAARGIGQAIADLEKIVEENLPPAVRLSYDGESRDFKETGSAIYMTFLLALVIAATGFTIAVLCCRVLPVPAHVFHETMPDDGTRFPK